MAEDWTNLSDLYPLVTPELPGCPLPLILQRIRKVIIEFCRDSQAWEYDLDPINVRDGTTDYDLDLDTAEAVIDQIQEVLLEDSEIFQGEDFIMASPVLLSLIEEPSADVDGGLEVTVSLRPSRTATTIDPRLFDDWADCWAAGVKAELMVMPGKPWTDQSLSRFYKAEYHKGLSQAKNRAATGDVNQTIRFGG